MTQTRNLEGVIIVLKQQKSWREKDPMNKNETAGISCRAGNRGTCGQRRIIKKHYQAEQGKLTQ